MNTKLIIVESPTKVRSIKSFLSSDYQVISTSGHFVTLKRESNSVIVEDSIKFNWVVDDKKWLNIRNLFDKHNIKEVIIATDFDREGELIAWHLESTIKNNALSTDIFRITFTEITKQAILEAIKNKKSINYDLSDAALARTALDYLVGFGLSPLTWDKVPGALSIGRVQSPTLSWLVKKELDIINFASSSFKAIALEFDNIRTDNTNFKNTFNINLDLVIKKLMLLDKKISSSKKSYFEKDNVPLRSI